MSTHPATASTPGSSLDIEYGVRDLIEHGEICKMNTRRDQQEEAPRQWQALTNTGGVEAVCRLPRVSCCHIFAETGRQPTVLPGVQMNILSIV